MILPVPPVIATFGPITIRAYTLLLDLGLAAGLAWLYFKAPENRRLLWFDAGLVAILGGLVGARLLYALANFSFYATHVSEIFQIWLGGLAWPGAAAGGLAGVWLYCSRKREPLGPIVDALAIPVVLLSLASWGGCWAAGCAHGYEVAPGQLPQWFNSTSPDIYGVIATRWPTQMVGVVWSVLALGAVYASQRNSWPAGARGAYALGLVALGPLFLGFTRGDPMLRVSGIRLDIIGSAILLLAATFAWVSRVARRPHAPRPTNAEA